jgi:ABC-type multidrug transport system ATPase subunit
MEEADVLCNRIGIVSDGILRCVAPQVRLKSIYGGGYHLFINCQKGKVLQLLRQLRRQQKKQEEKRIKAEEKLKLSRGEPVVREEKKHTSSEDEDDEPIDDKSIAQRVVDFIKFELPNAILIREFNGNFVY